MRHREGLGHRHSRLRGKKKKRFGKERGRTRLQSWRLRLCTPRRSFGVPSRTVSVVGVARVRKKVFSFTNPTEALDRLHKKEHAPVSRSRARVIRADSGTRWASRRLRCIRVRRGGGAHSARGRRSGVVVGRASLSRCRRRGYRSGAGSAAGAGIERDQGRVNHS